MTPYIDVVHVHKPRTELPAYLWLVVDGQNDLSHTGIFECLQ